MFANSKSPAGDADWLFFLDVISDLLANFLEEAFHVLLFRHFHSVAGHEELARQVSEGELDKGFVLAGAEKDAYR